MSDNDHPTIKVSSDAVQEQFDTKMQEMGIAQKEEDTKARAAASGVPYVELARLAILPDVISLIDEEQAKAAQAVCFFRDGDQLRVAAVEPASPAVQQLVTDLTEQDYQVTLYTASEHAMEHGLGFYRAVPHIKKIERGVKITAEQLESFQGQFDNFEDLAKKIRKVSTTDLIAFVISSAMDSRASDIHIEAEEKKIQVRFRIDGILHDIVELPTTVWKQVASRIKLLASLKINVTDKPQDGSFTITAKEETIDVRTSTIPTNYGESIVMRLLRSSSTAIGFDDLGLRGKAHADLSREVTKPNGMIITTGPTGSGKTTTLYAILNKLNSDETKIITLEDPIEYKLSGINQSQVHTDDGYTFAKGLRSILRQDPDVIMVGEIRDLDTADTAINAALTGHLVISTLHTNSAAATIPRLLSMGVKPFLVAPSINAMIGQRLVRKICPDCKEKHELDSATMAKVVELLSGLTAESGEHNRVKEVNQLEFYRGAGCDACQGLGYKGRIGIYEIMTMTEEIEQLILNQQVSEYQMQEIAVKNGMITMVQDGLLKAADGITTVEEVFRVTK